MHHHGHIEDDYCFETPLFTIMNWTNGRSDAAHALTGLHQQLVAIELIVAMIMLPCIIVHILVAGNQGFADAVAAPSWRLQRTRELNLQALRARIILVACNDEIGAGREREEPPCWLHVSGKIKSSFIPTTANGMVGHPPTGPTGDTGVCADSYAGATATMPDTAVLDAGASTRVLRYEIERLVGDLEGTRTAVREVSVDVSSCASSGSNLNDSGSMLYHRR
jgi:hypothetical protein